MLIVLMIIFGLLIGLGVYLYNGFDMDFPVLISTSVGIFGETFMVIILTVMLFVYPFKVDEKIKLFEEENIKIEKKVKETVKVYMNYEQETYTNLVKDADLTTLLIVYPDLNSNELVKSEIALYIDNNNEIKKLKEEKINRSVYRFWLYFGK